MLSNNLIFLSRTRCIYCNNPPSSRMKGRAYWGLSHKWAYTASDSAIWMNGTFSELVSEMVSHLRFYKIKTKLKENDDVLWSLMNVNVIFSVNPIHYYVQLFPQKSHFYLNIKVKVWPGIFVKLSECSQDVSLCFHNSFCSFLPKMLCIALARMFSACLRFT